MELLPCSLDHPNRKLALTVGAALLARYDGGDLPEVDEDEEVELGDEGSVGLSDLVRSMMQFVTADDLQTKCVLTTDVRGRSRAHPCCTRAQPMRAVCRSNMVRDAQYGSPTLPTNATHRL